MASSETCPCQTNMRIGDWQPQIMKKQKIVCPYVFAKIKPRFKENQALCVAQTCQRGKHALATTCRLAPPNRRGFSGGARGEFAPLLFLSRIKVAKEGMLE